MTCDILRSALTWHFAPITMPSITHTHSESHWLHHRPLELIFIIAPAFVVTGCIMAFPDFFGAESPVSPLGWLLLVVGVDVAHVYSTLFRTYLHAEMRQRFRKILIWVPLLCLIAMVTLYAWLGTTAFWTLLAYLAVFHFVRQQYGFFRLYSRKVVPIFSWEKTLDAAVIYGATLYPLIYWHAHLPRNFYWFRPGDFMNIPFPLLAQITGIIYVLLIVGYVAKEGYAMRKGRSLNVPRQLVLLGTMLSWYVGIVVYNGDLAFTATNVIAHGIPYMALVWISNRKEKRPARKPSHIWGVGGSLLGFLALILGMAYVEEGLWDGLVWREHGVWFAWAEALPFLADSGWLVLAVPILALPQVTHYVVDGFIWRRPKQT